MPKVKPGQKIYFKGIVYRAGDTLPSDYPGAVKKPLKKERINDGDALLSK